MVEMFDDRIEITNPGGLVKGLRPEDFGKKSVLRNPNIANLLHRIEYIEKMGTGISKIRKLIKSAGLPNVKFEFNTFFTATFKRPRLPIGLSVDAGEKFVRKFREKFSENFSVNFGKFLSREAVTEGISEGISEGIKIRLIKEVVYIRKEGSITRKIIEQLCTTSTASAERDISILKKLGIIKFEGSRKTGKYVLTERGKALIKEMIK
jgi:Predicted transcriptional regulator containing an HTH domain and an uncharacterized domain shared with the mammalian protein Schlafen